MLQEKELPLAVPEAVSLLKAWDTTKFDQTVELSFRLGIDPRQADQMVRGSVVLPNGIGKSLRVVVFAKGDKATEAQEAGADEVGAEELQQKIKDGWLDFDVCIATPDMMALVSPLGRTLGPRGLMPNPRAGTLTMEVAKVVGEYKSGKVEFRNNKEGVLHGIVGKMSFDEQKLVENVEAFIKHIQSLKPNSLKGHYFRSVYLTATMAPGIQISA
ncbi:Ribosomal protein [Planctomycetales bacterium 10988]|nr:Ribosomal protein [Planctomycetales bacterium 10988]